MKKELIGLVKKNKDVIIVAGAIGTVLGHKIGYFRSAWASASVLTRREEAAKIEIDRLEEIIKKQEEHISDLIKGQ